MLKNETPLEVKQEGNAPEVVPSKTEEPTIGEALEKEVKPEQRVVPEATFLEQKNKLKESEKALADLKEKVANGATKVEIANDVHALAEKHGVDESFLQELATIIETKNKSEFDTRLKEGLAPYESEAKQKKINETFEKLYAEAMAKLPELEGKVIKDTIKDLSMIKLNENKTFSQLIEETYGHLVTGKRTIDHSSAGNNRETGVAVDKSKSITDQNEFNKVMADPQAKKEYNEGLTDRLSKVL